MDPDFWRERWAQNQIGFHQGQVNALLLEHWHCLNLPAGARILVPLCGKSLDMLWLRQQGYAVVGVEISPIAARAFFEENGLQPSVTTDGRTTIFQDGNLQIVCGDFFALPPASLGGVDGVYDRAALIALPPDMRAAYARKLQDLLPACGKMLLVTLEYPQSQMQGPPFSVVQDEVHALYGARFGITRVVCEPVLDENPKLRERGVSSLAECVYLLHGGK